MIFFLIWLIYQNFNNKHKNVHYSKLAESYARRNAVQKRDSFPLARTQRAENFRTATSLAEPNREQERSRGTCSVLSQRL